jgi:3-polyprenyl-4-hydroxybenzoate decarboxylase
VWQGNQIDLRKIPVMTTWPEDGGPFITLPMVISTDPKRGIRNVGMYRVQVLGPRTVAMHWQRHKVGAALWREMAERGETMPVCIAIGADPASIYATTIVGRPPMEDYYLGHATERIFLPLLKLTIPEVVDYHMPAEGIFHNLVFVSIDKQFPGQAQKVMNAMWGQGLMSLAKVLVVVDKDVNVRDPQEAWWVALNNIDPERDTRFTMGPVDVLDHASRAFTYGSKMGIDATRKWPEEGFARNWPKVIAMDDATKARVDAMWGEMGIGAQRSAPRGTR